MSQVGRISGPVLTANLERNGIDLAFRNTTGQTQLLYLDVNSGRIGVNQGVSGHELDISGISRTTELLGTTADIDRFEFRTNNINVLVGDINLSASEAIKLPNFETDNINISDNSISSYRSNSDIDLRPNGTGIVDVFANLEVYGNLHSTENITLDGTVTFGDTLSEDTVTFDAGVNSDIIPSLNNTYDLGSTSKRWNLLESQVINGTRINTNFIDAGPTSLGRRAGNMFYVSVNGNDSNVGDHPNGPFATIKRALQASDASIQGPVTIHVFAGEYQEDLPLTVPSNVSVIGEDMRNTIITPDTSTQSSDVFLLNGESTVQNLTIKNFYSPGYAFRFAPNTVVSTRSPYVQNVTVSTQGTTTSASDPRGFDSGDAGRGALVDGASVNSASQEASMLFHSVTFITPGANALTMTNGVRVEWLNSFTYFANRGLYAVDGVTGHLSTDGSTVKYGAELRAIGSANVYGNYGAVADGSGCLMYLVQHNFAYIGTGKILDNDPSRVIQTQEVSELNSGKIYYSSTDHLGNFRVGDDFFVDLESGETSLVLTEAQVDSLGGLNITTNGNTTVVDGDKVETGNLRFSGNTILSTFEDINITGANGLIDLSSNTFISNNLDLTGNLSFGGSLNLLGDQTTDIVDFNVDFDQDINPNQNGIFSLGTTSKRWINTNSNRAYFGDVLLYNNYVTTFVSNADLELRANGTGKLYVPNNDLEITNNLAVDGITNLQDLNTNSFVLANNLNISTNFATTNLTVENLTVGSQAQFEEINIDGNVITTTTSNANLELRANSTGNILIPTNDMLISNNLDVQGAWDASDINVNTQVIATQFDNNTINITSNIITTDISNADLELRSTGDIKVDDSLTVTNNFTVQGATTLLDTTINGLLTHSGTFSQTGNRTITGDLDITASLDISAAVQFEEILIDDNYITTTSTNADLELRASGSGQVRVPNNNVNITNNLSLGTLNASTINIDNEFELENMVSSTDIEIFDNVITTTNSNSDLELRANGTGNKVLENILLNQNTLSTLSTSLLFAPSESVIITSSSALLIPVGTTDQRPSAADVFVDGGLASPLGTLLDGGSASTIFGSEDTFYNSGGSILVTAGNTGDLRFNSTDNVFEGTGVNSTISFNGVYSADRLTSLTAHPTNNTLIFKSNNVQVGTVNSTGITLHGLEVDDVTINQATITTDVSNSDLELEANGSGNTIIDDFEFSGSTITNTNSSNANLRIYGTGTHLVRFAGNHAVRFPSGTTAQRPASPVLGLTRQNTDTDLLETWDGTQWIPSAGITENVSEAEMEDLALEQTLIYG
jgi:hypothetical protein